MARIEITLNGRRYPLTCEDGQEPRIRKLAAYVDDKLTHMVVGGGIGSDSHLLAMTALVLADELFDRADELASMRARINNAPHEPENAIATLSNVIHRIEELAAKIERA
ncbi:cell division protein ZapA [Azospirillaceae bacterium]